MLIPHGGLYVLGLETRVLVNHMVGCVTSDHEVCCSQCVSPADVVVCLCTK
jgi:hypothetical protein